MVPGMAGSRGPNDIMRSHSHLSHPSLSLFFFLCWLNSEAASLLEMAERLPAAPCYRASFGKLYSQRLAAWVNKNFLEHSHAHLYMIV